MVLSRLVSLSISSLRNLDIEANKFYDRAHRLYEAAILTRCYTQHALWPDIDIEINHIKHDFIKVQFVNKGIEFINLPSIFKDNSVISSIPTYFENKESHIICYMYNKPILSKLNYNELVTELDIETAIPDSWECKESKYCYQPPALIITGDLRNITDSISWYFIICKGPKYRFPLSIYFNKCREEIAGSLQFFFCNRRCQVRACWI